MPPESLQRTINRLEQSLANLSDRLDNFDGGSTGTNQEGRAVFGGGGGLVTSSGALRVEVEESVATRFLGPAVGNVFGGAIEPIAPYLAIGGIIASGFGDELVDLGIRFAGSITRHLIESSDDIAAALAVGLVRETRATIETLREEGIFDAFGFSEGPGGEGYPVIRGALGIEGPGGEGYPVLGGLARGAISTIAGFQGPGGQGYPALTEIAADTLLGLAPGFYYEAADRLRDTYRDVSPDVRRIINRNRPRVEGVIQDTRPGIEGFIDENLPRVESVIDRTGSFLNRQFERVSDFVVPPAESITPPVNRYTTFFDFLTTRTGRRNLDRFQRASLSRYDEIANPVAVDATRYFDPSERLAPVQGGFAVDIFRGARGLSGRELDSYFDDFVSIGEDDVSQLGSNVYDALLESSSTRSLDSASTLADRILDRANVDEFGQFRLSSLFRELDAVGIANPEDVFLDTISEDIITRPLVSTLPRNARLFRGVTNYESQFDEAGNPIFQRSGRYPIEPVGLSGLRYGDEFTLGNQLYTTTNPLIAEGFATRVTTYQGPATNPGIINLQARRGSRFSVSQGGFEHNESEILFVDPNEIYRAGSARAGDIANARTLNPNIGGYDDIALDEFISVYSEGGDSFYTYSNYYLPDALQGRDLDLPEIPSDIQRAILDEGESLEDIAPNIYNRLRNELIDTGAFTLGEPASTFNIRQVGRGSAGAIAGVAGLTGLAAFGSGTPEAQALEIPTGARISQVFEGTANRASRGLNQDTLRQARNITTDAYRQSVDTLFSVAPQEEINAGARYISYFSPGTLANTVLSTRQTAGTLRGIGRAFPQSEVLTDPLVDTLDVVQDSTLEAISELPFGERIREQALIAEGSIDGLASAANRMGGALANTFVAFVRQTDDWTDRLAAIPSLLQDIIIELTILRPATNFLSDLFSSVAGSVTGNLSRGGGEGEVVINQTINDQDTAASAQYTDASMAAAEESQIRGRNRVTSPYYTGR